MFLELGPPSLTGKWKPDFIKAGRPAGGHVLCASTSEQGLSGLPHREKETSGVMFLSEEGGELGRLGMGAENGVLEEGKGRERVSSM